MSAIQIDFSEIEAFLADLGATIDDFDRHMADWFEESARTLIVPEAKGRAASLVHPNLAGNPTRPGSLVVSSIRAHRTGNEVSVSLGGAHVPQAFGHEFGAVRYRWFPVFTGTTGYFFFPAIRDTRERAFAMYGEHLMQLFSRAYPG